MGARSSSDSDADGHVVPAVPGAKQTVVAVILLSGEENNDAAWDLIVNTVQ